MAPGGPESDLRLQDRIGALGLKQIFLIFRVYVTGQIWFQVNFDLT